MIRICDLTLGYRGKKIGQPINGRIMKGSMVAVMGPNGIGKSTFLKTLAGFLSPISGRLEFENKKIKLNISYLPQKVNIDYDFPVTVFDVVSMGCWPRISFFNKLDCYQEYLIREALDQVKLSDVLNQCVNRLSGGQIQRMLFARMLVQQASFILLDEPFQGIDQVTCKTLMCFVNKLCKCGSTVVVVLHDNIFLSEYFSETFLLN